jgi:hypothetical protein
VGCGPRLASARLMGHPERLGVGGIARKEVRAVGSREVPVRELLVYQPPKCYARDGSLPHGLTKPCGESARVWCSEASCRSCG